MRIRLKKIDLTNNFLNDLRKDAKPLNKESLETSDCNLIIKKSKRKSITQADLSEISVKL